MIALTPPLLPRSGHVLRVILICRISTEHQDTRALADQEALLRRWLADHYDKKMDVTVIAGRGSGERLTRVEAEELNGLVATGQFDLLLTEDLGRIYRRLHALLLCEECQDQGIRVITLNDHLDTFQEGWQLHGMFAAMRHEQYNADTSKRIRRSLRNRFTQGGVVHEVIYGYEKPPGVSNEASIRKLSEAQAVYDRWFQILEQGGTFVEVAAFLNREGVPLGPYIRLKRWTGSMVARVTRNPILKGLRQRNRMMSKRINRTGERRPVKAPPEELLERECPHLAFIEPERYDRVIQQLQDRNAKFRRRGVNGIDQRKGVPKKRTRWPGQHLICGICGKGLVYGAHGQPQNLICRGAKDYQCWMSMSVRGPQARAKLLDALWREIEQMPDFTAEMRQCLVSEALAQNQGLEQKLGVLRQRQTEHQRHTENLQRSLREFGPSELLHAELQRLTEEGQELQILRYELEQQRFQELQIPTLAQIQSELKGVLSDVTGESSEAARILHRLLPQIVVYPFRLVGSDYIVVRAQVTLDLLASWSTPLPAVPDLCRTIWVDLFDHPQRVAYREQVVRLRASGMTERQAAELLGLTQTAAQKAAQLQRTMDWLQVTEPYQRLYAPPADSTKYVRHRHPLFQQAPQIAPVGE